MSVREEVALVVVVWKRVSSREATGGVSMGRCTRSAGR